MAKASEQEHTGSTLARAGKRKWGYDTSQVDEFLNRIHELYEDDEPRITQEEIQNTAFALQKDGYKIDQVDAALRRLENAVVDKQTQWDINRSGRIAWQAQTQALAATLLGRAEREERQRFSDGLARHPSYDRKQVDNIVSQIARIVQEKLEQAEQGKFVAELEDTTNGDKLAAEDIANVIFTQRRGKHGYAERQVDAYLNRAVQVFSRWESYNRVADLLNDDNTVSREDGETQVIAPIPLFPQATLDSGSASTKTDEHREYGYANPVSDSASVRSSSGTNNSDVNNAAMNNSSATGERSAFEDIRRQEQALFTPSSMQDRSSIFSAESLTEAMQRVSNAPSPVQSAVQSGQVSAYTDSSFKSSDDVSEARTASFTPIFDGSKPDYNAELQKVADHTHVEQVAHPAPASSDMQSHITSADDAQTHTGNTSNAHNNGYNGTDGMPTTNTDGYAQKPDTAQSAPSSNTDAWSFSDADWHIDSPALAKPDSNANTGVVNADASTNAHTADVSSQGAGHTPSLTPKADTASSPDDYFSKLLDMDTVESTDFHIPSLTFPDTDTVQPAHIPGSESADGQGDNRKH